jgi:CoA:oxalate CoA-transferase
VLWFSTSREPWAGPFCTALLADMGATVFKVESVEGGDSSRSWPPFEENHSLYFDSVNRGKQSIAVNFRSDAGRALLRRMTLSVDVVVENFRSGVMAELGLDPDELRAEKPELIVASITGFGATGPLARAPGFDQVVQGMSGIMSITGCNSEDVFRVGLPIIDTVTGIFCALGIASALAGRGAAGQGASVETSLLESAIAISTFQGQQYLSSGEVPHPHGNDHPVLAPYGVFATADIPITVAVGNQEQWRSLCEVLGLPELIDHPHYKSGSLRSTHREALKDRIGARLLTDSGAEWVTMLQAAQIPCGPHVLASL